MSSEQGIDIELVDKKRGTSLYVYPDISLDKYVIFDIDGFFVGLDYEQVKELQEYLEKI